MIGAGASGDSPDAREVHDSPVWRPSLRGVRLLSVVTVALGGALLFDRAWLVGFALPAALLLVASPPTPRARRVETRTRVAARRCLEGEEITVEVAVDTDEPLGWVDPEVAPGLGVTVREVSWDAERDATAESGGSRVRLRLAVPRWGRWRLGVVALYLHDTTELLRTTVLVRLGDAQVFPAPTPDNTTLVPVRLPNRFGEHVARLAGDGMEFHGVRPYARGDRQRRINWPATTRRRELQVNQFDSERAADAVVVIDAYSDIGPAGSSTLDRAVRGAAGLAHAHLATHDRVGVVSIGGQLRWLGGGTGAAHLYRIAETVMDVRRDFGHASLDVSDLPRRVLPPGAVLYVLTPLVNVRMVEVLRDVWERGFAMVVIEIDCPEPRPEPGDLTEDLAVRLWRLDRQALRFSLGQLGIPLTSWNGEDPLDLPLAPYTRHALAGRSR